jgi:hypothetical protein
VTKGGFSPAYPDARWAIFLVSAHTRYALTPAKIWIQGNRM